MAKNILSIMILLLLINSEERFGLKSEDDVVVLKKENFDEFINKNELVMVEFYAPWCAHCKTMAPKLSELAKSIKDIPIAKINVDVESELAGRFNIRSIPSFKLFVKNTPIDYRGQWEVPAMKKYILSKKDQKKDPTDLVNTNEQLNKLKKENKVLIVFFGENGTYYETFKLLALKEDKLKFVHVFDKSLMKENKAEFNSVILYKQFDEKMNTKKSPYDLGDLNRFVERNRYPNLVEFDQENTERIFTKKEPTIFLFDQGKSKYYDMFKETAKEMKGKIIFAVSTIENNMGYRISEFIGVKSIHTPCIRIIEFVNNKLEKYKMDSWITKKNIINFITDFNEKKLKKYYKSDPLPEFDKNDLLKSAVGNNFEKLVLDDNKDVLLEVFAPWCEECKKLSPILKRIANNLKNNNNFVIATMDGTANEHPSYDISNFPTIHLFKRNQKKNPIEFKGEHKYEALAEFLEKNLNIKIEDKKVEDL